MDEEKQKKYSVFIVDDDKFLLDMYVLKFGERGYEVASVLSAGEALAKFAEGYEPDVLLLDLVMPNMDGFALLQKVKEKKMLGKTAIVALSNLGQKEDIEKGLKMGADGYIIKASSTPSEVVDKVAGILEEKRKSWQQG